MMRMQGYWRKSSGYGEALALWRVVRMHVAAAEGLEVQVAISQFSEAMATTCNVWMEKKKS